MLKVPAVVFVLFLGAVAASQTGNDVLVLLDNLAIKETHSIFFKNLIGMQQESQFKLTSLAYVSSG